MATKVAVIGAGSWGTAVASLSVRNAPTVLWARSPEVADEIARVHTNSRYLSGVTLPSGLGATSKLADALHGADVVVMAVPSHGFRDVLEEGRSAVGEGVPIVSLTKGVEQGTLNRMTEII